MAALVALTATTPTCFVTLTATLGRPASLYPLRSLRPPARRHSAGRLSSSTVAVTVSLPAADHRRYRRYRRAAARLRRELREAAPSPEDLMLHFLPNRDERCLCEDYLDSLEIRRSLGFRKPLVSRPM
jgi:hypothetical protein